MIHTKRWWRTALFLSLVLLAASCSSDDDDQAFDTSTSDVSEVPEDETTVTDPDLAGIPGADGIGINEDGVDPLPPLPDDVALPLVFVHGFAGSAQQYESQAMRFVANGYPQERILDYDHDGAGVDIAGYAEGVAEVVDAALAEFGTDQVYLVGHSRGTTVSTLYLEDPSNAAKVAKYIAIDGSPCPDVVTCIAPTQELFPGQAHVEVATSRESFAMQYEFLVGEAPEVIDVVAQRDPVVISGRAVNFPENTGRDGTTLDIFKIDPATGSRIGDTPHASFEIGPEGDFGPLVVESGAHYEYRITSADSETQHHLYLQPYVRSSHFARLLSSPPDGPTRVNTNTGDGHAAVVAIRMREWYGEDDPDLDGDERDVLEISTQIESGEVEMVNAIAGFIGNGAIGLHIHDDAATPGQTTLKPLPYFSDQPFQSGIDVYMPGSDVPDGFITVTNFPRGDRSDPQTLNIPNWASVNHTSSVVFTDYPVD